MTSIAQAQHDLADFPGPWTATVKQSATTVTVAVKGLADDVQDQYGSASGAIGVLVTGGYVGSPPHPFAVDVSAHGATVAVTVRRK